MNINININLSKKTIIITSICIVVIGFIFAIIGFLNSEFYWNEIILKNAFDTHICENSSRYDFYGYMKYHPKEENLNVAVMFNYNKDITYFNMLKKIITDIVKTEDAEWIKIKFENNYKTSFNKKMLLQMGENGFYGDFNIKMSKDDMRKIKNVSISEKSKVFDLNKQDAEMMKKVIVAWEFIDFLAGNE